MLSARPKIAELSFQLYGRSLHPELFEIFASKEFSRGDYTARVSITTAGHLISWHRNRTTISEVATSAHYPLPNTRQLATQKLCGKHSETVTYQGGIEYSYQFHLEPSPAESFWFFQEELMKADHDEGVFHSFESSGRIAIGALSFIHTELRDRSFTVQAFHTFPDDFAILKTRSQVKF